MKKSEQVIGVLKKISECRGLAFFGSVGRGKADKNSDVDIVCFVEKVPDKINREKLLRSIGARPAPNVKIIDSFEYIGADFTIWYKTIDDMESDIKNLIDKEQEWMQGNVNNFIAKTKIIWDPRSYQKKWRKRVSRYPKYIKTKKFELISACQSKLEAILNGIRRQQTIYIQECLWQITEHLVQILYVLNNEYFSTTKLFFEDVKKFKILPNNCVNRFIEATKPETSLLDRIKLLRGLLFDIIELSKKQQKDLKPKRSKEWCDRIVRKIGKEL